MSGDFRPWALELHASPDQAFDLADTLGMEGEMTAIGVTIFDAPNGLMLVQALYEQQASADLALQTLPLPDSIKPTIRQLPAKDWVKETQAGLAPVRAGRFYVYGSHDADTVPTDVLPLRVDAGMAFGTGHHGTTAGCLKIFSELLDSDFSPKSVLDLGCGAGILAIAAAKTLAQADIVATDIDPDAIEVSRSNIVENSVSGRIETAVADGFESEILKGKIFDLIFANILAGPLMGLADDIANATAPGGFVILSGILDEKAEAVTVHFRQTGMIVTPQPSLNGWTSLLGKTPD